ncbi:diphosphate--fructose-6-phosphate 1-phosphotransferase [Xanthomonas citri pv. citri]|uniref:Pyrophosphate--fructose 6-phosphate 1-phosphotransferase n=9 Tax=Xanthomonas citri TaxID=346 RepID=A0AAI7ZHR1_XANAC|nr:MULTISPECIES: 6-phosphofructokinase [Xanthomonas]AAM38281.1 6-phosphofructokinase [Xanthomonas citri pv. citri str. 306]AGH78914.1 6-phosphofructokinase [Xanthomonas axonopodis Xac29-1]AGI09897.1 6-phosphofructokinase [Xanthomonas citri subsp. citri Aw12879]AJD70029.1 pyrophosphate-dependent phosphofructokinase [Xanthomonas citri subsp. citri A306]AJY83541.1 pyrophosphate-dependent phosphofructokinase [Xanthomonas citri pv. citri]
MTTGNLLYAQSGGVTAVINATAAGVIAEARARKIKVLAARNGILGALREELIDTSKESAAAIAALAQTPGGAFGSCRYKLKSLEEDSAKYERLLDVLRAHDVRWFLYNGGNDSADTAWKVSQLAKAYGYPLHCIGVPKTIDNDLAATDTCPGFGSAAKYTVVSVREAALDVAAMADTSTKVFIYEAMGRHAGWLAAAAGLAGQGPDDAPQIILLPERAYDQAAFLAKVKQVVEKVGWCVVVASEGIQDAHGKFVADAGGAADSFGHAQLGGVASFLAAQVKQELGYKVHWTLPDYLQRSARHLASKTDWEQAQAVGKAAVQYAIKGMNAVIPVIERVSDAPYRWKIVPAPLHKVANHEKKMPPSFLRKDGFGITERARRYFAPLIKGEAALAYGSDGLPKYVSLKNVAVAKKLPAWEG